MPEEKKKNETEDYIVRASAADSAVRAFAVTSRNLAEEARVRHQTSPVVTAALGRLLSGAAMMGAMLKGEDDLLTLQIRSQGPLRGMTATADAAGNVKGYPLVPDVDLPLNAKGKLDVGGAVGPGELSVIKDMGLKEPYMGRVDLQTGEIADDLTYYFAVSEQVPSAVGLGVLVNPDGSVRQAGGFLVQLLPFAGDDVIDRLEKNLAGITSVTELLDAGYSPEGVLSNVLDGLDLHVTDTLPARFHCSCSKERVRKVVAGVGEKDLREMIAEGKPVTVKCDFCNTDYVLQVEELEEILKSGKK